MVKQAFVWLLVFTFALSVTPVQAKVKSSTTSKSKMSHYASPAEQRYLSAVAHLEAADKGPSLLELLRDLLGGDHGNAKDKDRDEPQRGDPKTDFSRSENRFHSLRQHPCPSPTPPPNPEPLPTPAPAPVPEPDPAPDPKPLPDPDPVPDPEPVPSPEPIPSTPPVLDLTQWTLANQYLSGTNELSVYFKQAEDGLYDVVLVVYDTLTGQPLQATGYRTETIYTMPDRTGLTLVITSTQEDGSRMEKYGLLVTENQNWDDVRLWVEIFYDPMGMFQSATIKTVEDLMLESLVLPPLESIRL